MQYLEMKKGRVEIIPMIDIMLFLLIFFIMITVHMIPSQGLPAHLPGSSSAQELPKPKVVLTLHADGSLEIKDKTITLQDLETQLRQGGNPSETQVTIAADKGADIQALVKVMDACRHAGVTAIGLAAKPVS
ncbi:MULTISPECIES: ExbD/TolR family protein [Acidithiobacillus]|jgi:biopolymer transport protein ExbD|uniref:ExbD/TolR family protein n=1 Tax=Acidithiobacillus TaxID=119977 RepID=UPI00094ADA32|nr:MULTISPECIES: biopolymer transporter ExbD [Acidithiobacillus]MBE7567242.1 biopolymer transporter ExbD [Acidithiobacillus sp. HP-11]MBU2750014.1 biopolymer transporter ExbD [Acidithiobacillus thiooxidans]MBU2794767.1 biopolymer transporter ExbD [Acidithiobacillus thiooxidans]